MKCSLACLVFLLATSYGLPMFELPMKRPELGPNLGNLAEVAETLGLTMLIKTAEPFGIVHELETKKSLTLFGPNNEAFLTIPDEYKPYLMNSTFLKNLLNFHLVDSTVYANAIKNELLVQSQFVKKSIRFNVYGEGNNEVVTAQCSPIMLVNQNASNGVIHVLKRVMIPPFGTVTDLVAARKDIFGILLKAVLTAKLDKVLAAPGPYTVFAPTDKAFRKIPDLEKILKDIPLLTKILKYHVVSGTFCSAGLADKESVKTLEGSDVTIHKLGGMVRVNEAIVEFVDAPVSNGVVHVIDSVLIPKDN